MTEHKNMPEIQKTGKSTEHRCEWLMGTRAKGEWYIHEPVARCANKNCNILLSPKEIERILNEYETLKRATDVLSAEDAEWASGFIRSATNNHSLEQRYDGNHYYLSDTIRNYANILSPTDDISSTKER